MEAGSGAAGRAVSGLSRWRLWPLVPLLVLIGAVSLFASQGDSVLRLLGKNVPPADEFDVRRVEFNPGEIRIKVTNPQPDGLTIALVTVDDAIVPFDLDGAQTLGRLRSSSIVVRYDWVEDEPITVGVTSSTGIQTVEAIPAAVETPRASARSFGGYALIGALVGILPVALGLLWLPSLRRAAPQWLAAFMALTGGLLAFLALEALTEAIELQAVLPGPLGGTGVVLLGVAVSFFSLSLLSQRLARRGSRDGQLGGLALATLVAVGIGLHNLGEGLAIGSSFAFGELTLGTFLIVGFMVHNVTEGLGIAAPAAEGNRPSLVRLAALCLIAGAPAILGAWIGGFVTLDILGVLFFALAAGAALQVIVEVGRYLAGRTPGGLGSPYVVGGFLAGLALMYGTGVFVG
jgi:zinc transporter ZupT